MMRVRPRVLLKMECGEVPKAAALENALLAGR